MMNNMIQFAEIEFGIPMLDTDFDFTEYRLEHDLMITRDNYSTGA